MRNTCATILRNPVNVWLAVTKSSEQKLICSQCDSIHRIPVWFILWHLIDLFGFCSQKSARSILRHPVKQEVTWVSCTFSHSQNTFNHSCVYSCVSGGSVLISELTDWPRSSYLTDEMFQKVAEDYNTSAFQYMTGQCSPESDVCRFKRETPHIKHLLCLSRGTRRGPRPEEGLIFLLLLPQQLMLSNRKWKRWPLPGRDLNVDMSNASALESNKDRAALIKLNLLFFSFVP